MTAQQLALFPHVAPVVISGCRPRSQAGLCAVDGCELKPVQVDRWGFIHCHVHRWRDDETLAEGRPL